MRTYDSQRITLDPGLTALALRGLREREGHYPFLDDATGSRRPPRAASTDAARPLRRLVSSLRRLGGLRPQAPARAA
jgi:hypothetical protein